MSGAEQDDDEAHGSPRRLRWWRPVSRPGRVPRSNAVLVSSFVLVVVAAVVIAASVSSSHSGGDVATTLSAPSVSAAPTGGMAPLTGVSVLPDSPSTTSSRPPAAGAAPSTGPSAAAASTSAVPAKTTALTPAGAWIMQPTSGTAVADTAGGTHPATASNVLWQAKRSDYFGYFAGSSSQITTTGPVVNTGPGSSFTVSAWVFMIESTTAFETAVSQDGSQNSAFYLQFSGPDNAWAFSRVSGDTPNASGIRALSDSAPPTDTWVHLVGVYDALSQRLSLYVDGVPQARTATDSAPYASSGDLAIGRGEFNGADTDWWNGSLKNVEIFNRALSAQQVDSLS